MSVIQVGNRCHLSSSWQIANTIDPWIGVRTADLTPDQLGTVPIRVNLGNKNGLSYLPKEATSFRVWCHLMRGQAPASGPSIGGSDVSCAASFSGFPGQPNVNFGASYANGGTVAGADLVETMGQTVEFPNIVDPNGIDWGTFYWQMRGSTPLGSAVILDLISFDVPAGENFNTTYPAYPIQNTAPASLLLYFNGDLLDHSPYAHPMLQNNSGLLGGGAFFDGTSSYQTVTGSPASLDFAGDFTIEVGFSATTRAPQSGSGIQRRILSFGQAGTPSIGIWIDPAGGGIVCGNEFTGPLKTGSIPVDLNLPMNLKWSRQGSTNILMIDGYQDGPSFTDLTHWTIGATNPEIGRLNNNNSGHFSGLISNVNIVNGAAI